MKMPRFKLRTVLMAIVFIAMALGIVSVTRENYRLRRDLRAATHARRVTYLSRIVTLPPRNYATVARLLTPTEPPTRITIGPATGGSDASDSMPNGADAFARLSTEK
jgi:hypothetical protein